MRRWATWMACSVLVVGVLAACGQTSDDVGPADERPLSEDEVTRVVAEMRRTVVRDGSGTLGMQIVSDLPGSHIERSSQLEWAWRPNRWEMTMDLSYRDGGTSAEPEGGRLVFRVVDDTMFISSPEWTGEDAGKWMAFSRERMEGVTGFDIPMASTRVPPSPVLALVTFRGGSGVETADGLELTGRVPFAVFAQLVGLSARVMSEVPNLRELVPMRDVQVTLGPDGRPLTLTIPRGDPPALPASSSAPEVEEVLPVLVEATESTVEYLEWGADVLISAPAAEDITQGQ